MLIMNTALLDSKPSGDGFMKAVENRFFRYLLASPKDRDWGLYVTDAGRTQIPPNSPYPPPGHPPGYNFSIDRGRVLHSYQLVYITNGAGFFETRDTELKKIEAGNVFFLFPNQWHRYWPNPETGWNEHWVGFNGDYANRLSEKKLFSSEKPLFNPGYDENLLDLFEKIIDVIKTEPYGFQQTIAAFTMEILSKLNSSAYSAENDAPYIQQVIQKAKSILAERIQDPIDAIQLANSLGVSYSWFRWAFKRYTGFPPHQYQLELRMEKAKFLLGRTHESVKQISDRLGFDSPYYFSRIFKKKTGKNPSQWRNQSRRE